MMAETVRSKKFDFLHEEMLAYDGWRTRDADVICEESSTWMMAECLKNFDRLMGMSSQWSCLVGYYSIRN